MFQITFYQVFERMRNLEVLRPNCEFLSLHLNLKLPVGTVHYRTVTSLVNVLISFTKFLFSRYGTYLVCTTAKDRYLLFLGPSETIGWYKYSEYLFSLIFLKPYPAKIYSNPQPCYVPVRSL